LRALALSALHGAPANGPRGRLDGGPAGLIVDLYIRRTGTGERLPERRPY